MRLRPIISLVVCLAATPPAKADVIKGVITGNIYAGPYGNTTDTLGLFGPRGGSVASLPFTLTYTYNTADFVQVILPPGPYGPGCTICTFYSSLTPSPSEQISITLNGVTLIYQPKRVATINFDPAAAFASTSFGQFGEGIDVGYSQTVPQGPAMAFSFGTTGDPDIGHSPQLAPASPYYENQLTFVNAASNFESFYFVDASNTAVTPEPSGLSMMTTGLLSALCCLRRRAARFTRR